MIPAVIFYRLLLASEEESSGVMYLSIAAV